MRQRLRRFFFGPLKYVISSVYACMPRERRIAGDGVCAGARRGILERLAAHFEGEAFEWPPICASGRRRVRRSRPFSSSSKPRQIRLLFCFLYSIFAVLLVSPSFFSFLSLFLAGRRRKYFCVERGFVSASNASTPKLDHRGEPLQAPGHRCRWAKPFSPLFPPPFSSSLQTLRAQCYYRF